ncbi:MAG: hypothetical protein AB7P21_23090 [Lautropia sp.]
MNVNVSGVPANDIDGRRMFSAGATRDEDRSASVVDVADLATEVE